MYSLALALLLLGLPLTAAPREAGAVHGTTARQTFTNISGTVKDGRGNVIPNARVTARNRETGLESSTTSDSEGNFRIENLRVGHYDVTVELSGFAPSTLRDVEVTIGLTSPLTLIVGDDEQPIITNPVSTGSITGTVVRRSDGRPIRDAEVTIRKNGEADGLVVRTNDSGRYEKSGLDIGRYIVSARAPGFRPSRNSSVRLQNSDPRTANFRLRPQ